MAKDILRNRHISVKFAKENNMEWFGIAALLLLLCYSAYPGKVKRLETKVKRLEKKQRGVAYMSKLINDLVGKQCIIRSEFIFSFAGKTELSCKSTGYSEICEQAE